MKDMITIQNLTKNYGKNRGVEDVTFSVREGEIFGFLGPNGAGKSTTIRSMLGLIKYDQGEIRINGLDSVKDREKILADIGYMPSEAWFYSGMTIREMLKHSADVRKVDCTDEAEKLCDRLQVDVKRKINELSLGNRKKVSIVCAMQHRPKLFVFDEPTSGLDPLMQNVFFELIQEYVDEGATCMLPMAVMEENITEDIYETAKLSINHSKVKTGMPSDVSEQYMKKYKAPTLVMAAEKDCLFPAKGVTPRAERIIENCTTYLLEGRGHMSNLTEEEKQMIVDFLKQD